VIRDTLVMLCQEPWCFAPETIERLTDWQITHLYAKPALERAEEIRKSSPDGKPATPKARPADDNAIPHEPGTPEHRGMIVAGMMAGPFQMSREAAEKSYDKQLAAYREGK
jgi:hypothetical protein